MQLAATAPKSKPATDDLLTGQAIELCNDTCRCGSFVVIVDNGRQLNCRSCGRKRGYTVHEQRGMFARRGFAMLGKDDDGLDATISVRVSSRERARLEELAALDDRPVSALARRLLRQFLETKEERAA